MYGFFDGNIVARSKDGNAITDIPFDVVDVRSPEERERYDLHLGDGVGIYFPRDLRTSDYTGELAAFEDKAWLAYGLGYTRLRHIPLYDGPYCSFGEPYVLRRPEGNLEIALRRSDAMKRLCLKIGDSFSIYPCGRGDFVEKQNAYSMKQLYDRNLFDSDEQFANFRPLPHCKGVYRSASPFDDAYRRRLYAEICAQKYGIASILDLADTEQELLMLLDEELGYVGDLYKHGRVIAAGDDSGFKSLEFSSSIVRGLKTLIHLPKPWLIHCRAGKRRSGFVCALLEGIAGASLDELVEDYMLSYRFNNGLTKDDYPSEYRTISHETIYEMLDFIRNKPEYEDPGIKTVDWHNQCLGFLITHGMSLDEALELKRLIISE